MAKLRFGTSYWLDQYTGKPSRCPALTGSREADVAIIGGGFTGCLSAFVFAQAGFRVLLIESQRIGRGSTAASTALLMQEPDLDFRELASRYGTTRARRVWRQGANSVRRLVTLLHRLRIDASIEDVPSVYWTRDPSTVTELKHELRRRHAAGLSGRWLSRDALARQTGIEGAGAILTHGNAQIDPYRACLGLAHHARGLGARLYERSAATRVLSDRRGVHIVTAEGEIRARWAVIATGYATPEFKPLASRFRMSTTYVITTAPLARATRRRMGLGHVILWDTETPYHYARWTPDRRIIFGGRDQLRTTERSRATALVRQTDKLKEDLAGLFPDLASVPTEYAWDGLFATTPDGLPYVGPHRRYPSQLFALGYGGNGMTFTHLATQILLRVVTNHTADDDRFLGFGRFS
jgi:glycine/D-amino acid oxidase-like deaminating enzyme